MARSYFLMFVPLVAFNLCSACSKTEEQGFDCAQLDEFIAGVMECKKIPGMSVALVKEQDTVLTKGYGLADIDKGIPVGEETLFPIASMTKAFTATLWASLLKDLEDISTKTPLRDVLGSWFKLPDDFRTEQITLLDTFSHRTGLNDYNFFLVGFGMDMKRDDYIRRLRYGEEVFPFRTDYMYSNQMFTLAGYVAEYLKETDWASLMKERVLDALNMTSSTFCEHIVEREEGVAHPYVYNFSGNYYIRLEKVILRVVDLPSPAGAIVSNSVDMAKWLKFHIARGKNEKGEQVVDTDLLVDTYLPNNVFPSGPQTRPLFPVADIMPTYASGWANEMYRGYPKVYHDGSLGGYNSGISVFHTGNIGIVTLINGPYTEDAVNGMSHIHSYAADLLLGEEPWLNVSTACSYPYPWYPPSNTSGSGFETTRERKVGFNRSVRKVAKEDIRGRKDRLSIRRSNKVSQFGAERDTFMNHNVHSKVSNLNLADERRPFHRSGHAGHLHNVRTNTKYEVEKLIHAIRQRNVQTNRPLTDYAGMYGHLLLGNLTVFIDDLDGNLHYDYGLFGRGVLHPYLEDTFLFTMDTEMWYLYPATGMFMQFFPSNRDGNNDVLDRVGFPTDNGALFERDLKLPDGRRKP